MSTLISHRIPDTNLHLTQNVMKTIEKIKAMLTHHWLMMLAAVSVSIVVISCDSYEDEYAPRQAGKPVLTTTSTSVELKQKQQDNNAITLSWTAGSNKGTNSAINYTLEVGRKGTGFHDAFTVDAGKGSFARNFKVSEVNTLLRDHFKVMNETELEFRIISEAMDPSVEADTSNTLTIAAIPYEPMPVPENLYLVGDATPNGWDAGNPSIMIKSGSDPSVFTWQGQLRAGELKFLTIINEWIPAYQKGADETTLVIRSDFSQPDEKFTVSQAGLYRITVDVIELTFKLEALAASPYNELWIVGSATPKGWELNNADMMFQDPSDPFVFTYNEVLAAGEFKVATAKSWDAPFYRPLSANQPITDTDVQLSAGDPDHKWIISEPGPYKITLNIRDNAISITPFTPYENLWIVGDATPAGWNINAPVQMTRESEFIFTWTGQLNPGEFKFPIATGDWGTGYFMPFNADESIAETQITFRPTGSPDLKWRVQPGEEGVYTITLDQFRHTISIVKQ